MDLHYLKEKVVIETERKIISDIIHLLTIVSRSCSTVSKTNTNYRSKILDKLEYCHMVISSNIKNLRLFKKTKESMLRKLKNLSEKGSQGNVSYSFASDCL
jgi:hypothetical protein